MLKYHKLVVSFIFLIVMLLLQKSTSANDLKELTEENRIKSLAYQYIGFDSLSHLDSTENNIIVRKFLSKSATTQALTDRVTDGTVWMVYFEDVTNLLRKFSPELNNKNPRDLLIFIDSSSGIPLEIVSYHKEVSHKNFKDQSLEEILVEFNQRYDLNLITPQFPPKISFIEALSKSGLSDPRAERIAARYIMKRRKVNNKDTPTWFLHYKVNLDNKDGVSYPTNIKYIYSITSYIDADTGERISESWN